MFASFPPIWEQAISNSARFPTSLGLWHSKYNDPVSRGAKVSAAFGAWKGSREPWKSISTMATYLDLPRGRKWMGIGMPTYHSFSITKALFCWLQCDYSDDCLHRKSFCKLRPQPKVPSNPPSNLYECLPQTSVRCGPENHDEATSLLETCFIKRFCQEPHLRCRFNLSTTRMLCTKKPIRLITPTTVANTLHLVLCLFWPNLVSHVDKIGQQPIGHEIFDYRL